MPLSLSRRGVAALSQMTELDDEQQEILWLIKEGNDEPRGVVTLGNIVTQTGRGREAIRDVRKLIGSGYVQVFDY